MIAVIGNYFKGGLYFFFCESIMEFKIHKLIEENIKYHWTLSKIVRKIIIVVYYFWKEGNSYDFEI